MIWEVMKALVVLWLGGIVLCMCATCVGFS
jgi:hypothetical protein